MVKRRLAVLSLAVGLLGVAPAPVHGKRKPPPPPPPPADTADDCTAFVRPSIQDYLVLSTLDFGVECATIKQSITLNPELTRDGSALLLLPFASITCTSTSVCSGAIDLFSYDNHPIAFPGDQEYCVRVSGVVGGGQVGPAFGCEADARL